MRGTKHPYTGKKWLSFGCAAVEVVREARYKSGDPYVITEYFAMIRPARDGNGLWIDKGYVVTRNSFDELRRFMTYDEAKVYVESLFALENE